jgi:hypothetical protein
MSPEFFMALPKSREDTMRRREVTDGVIVSLRDASENEGAEQAVVSLPDVMCLGVKNSVRLR